MLSMTLYTVATIALFIQLNGSVVAGGIESVKFLIAQSQVNCDLDQIRADSSEDLSQSSIERTIETKAIEILDAVIPISRELSIAPEGKWKFMKPIHLKLCEQLRNLYPKPDQTEFPPNEGHPNEPFEEFGQDGEARQGEIFDESSRQNQKNRPDSMIKFDQEPAYSDRHLQAMESISNIFKLDEALSKPNDPEHEMILRRVQSVACELFKELYTDEAKMAVEIDEPQISPSQKLPSSQPKWDQIKRSAIGLLRCIFGRCFCVDQRTGLPAKPDQTEFPPNEGHPKEPFEEFGQDGEARQVEIFDESSRQNQQNRPDLLIKNDQEPAYSDRHLQAMESIAGILKLGEALSKPKDPEDDPEHEMTLWRVHSVACELLKKLYTDEDEMAVEIDEPQISPSQKLPSSQPTWDPIGALFTNGLLRCIFGRCFCLD